MKKSERHLFLSIPPQKVVKRALDQSADPFCLIFDPDEWGEEQDRLLPRLSSHYTLVTCVPQQNGSIQFLSC